MKINVYSILRIGLPILFCVVLVNCNNAGPSVVQGGDEVPGSARQPVIDLEDLILADLNNPDSLLTTLTPLLLSSPAVRALETWFDAKEGWEHAYNSSDTLLHCAKVIFDEFKEADKLSEAAKVRSAMGRLNYSIGNYKTAIDQQEQALELAREADDTLTMGWALGAMSSAYFNAKDIEKGRAFLFKAIEIGERINDPGIICLGMMGKSGYYSLLEKQDSAMAVMEVALRKARENGFHVIEAMGKLNYTFFLISTERYEEAIAALTGDQSIETFGVTAVSCVLHFNLYEAYFGKGDYQKAMVSLQEGCAQAEQLDFGFGKSFCEQSWIQFHEKQGDYKSALSAFRRYHEIDKNQFGEENQRRLELLENQREISNRDRKIDRLQQERVERRRIYLNRLYWGFSLFGLVGAFFVVVYFRSRIKMADQKKVIAESKLQVLQSQMKPHFIYNAMTGIQNYVLRSEKIEAYNYLGKFAALLRIITRTSTETHIELDREVDLIKTYLELEKMRFREAFVYKLEVDDTLLNLNREIPSMMIQPVVENSIIHGFSGLERQGELWVTLSPYQDGIKCVVKDNGRGRMAANEISKKETNQHLSIASVNSNERLEFLRSMGYNSARIEVEDHYTDDKATGTSVIIYLPFRTENN